MNAMTIHGGSAITMTSLELVDFINSQRADGESELRHDNFMAKVPKVLGKDAPKFLGASQYKGNGDAMLTRNIYIFPKREACLMAMSYSYELQAKVFDRMTALEARPTDPMKVLSDPAAMRGLLLTYTERVMELEAKVEEQQPKVEALDRFATISQGAQCISNAAKVLGVQPQKRLFALMHEHDWIFQRAGRWVATAGALKSGLMEAKAETVQRQDGTDKVVVQALVTAKGITKLSQMLNGNVA